MNEIGQAADRKKWRTVANAVMNFRRPSNAGEFSTN